MKLQSSWDLVVERAKNNYDESLRQNDNLFSRVTTLLTAAFAGAGLVTAAPNQSVESNIACGLGFLLVVVQVTIAVIMNWPSPAEIPGANNVHEISSQFATKPEQSATDDDHFKHFTQLVDDYLEATSASERRLSRRLCGYRCFLFAFAMEAIILSVALFLR
jgi:hypothetical protein